MQTAVSFHRFGELQAFIEEQQCARHDLEIGAFPITSRLIKRGGSACGVCFCIHGPRRVKLTAIWETDSQRLLLYDADGTPLVQNRARRIASPAGGRAMRAC